jgi:hypothetical protein
MQHITFPQQWLSIMEADASAWTAVVRKFRVTLHEIAFVEEATLVRVPEGKNAKDAVVYLDFHRKLSYDVGNAFLVTNQQTGENTVIRVSYTIDQSNFGSYRLVDATDEYDVSALQEVTIDTTGNRDKIEPLPIDDLEF